MIKFINSDVFLEYLLSSSSVVPDLEIGRLK